MNTLKKTSILITLFIIVLFVFLQSCNKNIVQSKQVPENNISIAEIREWSIWFEKTIPGAPKMKISEAQKRIWQNKFFVRVPLDSSTGMIYFTKTKKLTAVFIRQNFNNKSLPTEITNTEIIDLNARILRTITYKKNKADSLYTFVFKKSGVSNSEEVSKNLLWNEMAIILKNGNPRWNGTE